VSRLVKKEMSGIKDALMEAMQQSLKVSPP
jgi:hypothetical protein